MKTLLPVLKTLIAAATIVALGTVFAPAASADHDDDPCPLSMILLCRMLPIYPHLDGDIDLTKPQPTAQPVDQQPDMPPPPDPSPAGGGQ